VPKKYVEFKINEWLRACIHGVVGAYTCFERDNRCEAENIVPSYLSPGEMRPLLHVINIAALIIYWNHSTVHTSRSHLVDLRKERSEAIERMTRMRARMMAWMMESSPHHLSAQIWYPHPSRMRSSYMLYTCIYIYTP